MSKKIVTFGEIMLRLATPGYEQKEKEIGYGVLEREKEDSLVKSTQCLVLK